MNAAQRRTSSSSGSSQNGSPGEEAGLHDLGHPLEPLCLGQRLEQRRVDHRPTGQWKAPTRFLPCGRSIAVLPPIAASTWATRLVGTGTHATPRRYVAAANPAASVVQPPPSATIVPLRSRRNALPEPVEGGQRLRLLAGRQLVHLREPRAERELRVHAVDAGDVRIGDERDRAVAGDELAEPPQRAALDVDAGRGEDDVVGVPGDDVGDLRVERPALLVEPLELLAVPRERAIAPAHALPAVSTSTSSQTTVARSFSSARTSGMVTAPPPRSTTRGSVRREHVPDDLRLSRAECRLAVVEQRDRNVRVGLDVRETERAGDRRLPRAHEADEREVRV